MSNTLGPKTVPGTFDLVGKAHNYLTSAAPVEAAKEVVKEAVKTTAKEAVIQGFNPLTQSESLWSLAHQAQNVSNVAAPASAAVAPYVAPLFENAFSLPVQAVKNPISNTTIVPSMFDLPGTTRTDGLKQASKEVAIATAQGSSWADYTQYAGYVAGGIATVTGLALAAKGAKGLYNKFRSNKQAAQVLAQDAHAVLSQIPGFADAFAVLKDEVKVVLAKATVAQAEELKAIVESNASFFKDLLALPAAQQALQLVDTLKLVVAKPVIAEGQDLTQVDLNAVRQAAVNNPVLGQQQAASPAVSKFGALADRLMISKEAKQFLEIVGKHEKAMEVFAQLNEKSMQTLVANADKYAVYPKFHSENQELASSALVNALVGLAAKSGQTIEVEKKSALKMK